MTDWSEWVATCKRFVEGVESWPVAHDLGPNRCEIKTPLSEDEAREIESLMGRPLPAELREFYRTGSGGIACHWYWNPPDEYQEEVCNLFMEDDVFGGPSVINAWDQVEHHNWAGDLLGDWLRYGNPSAAEREVAKSLFPVVEIQNGDELLLHVPESGRGGKVYCFDHETHALIEISPTFEKFLRDWEHLYYVGPEGWMLTPFMEFENGGYCRLNMSLPNVAKWRNLVSRLQRNLTGPG